MAFKFNPLTGELDLVEASTVTDSFDADKILTGPTTCLYSGDVVPLTVLISEDGNVLIEE